MTHISDFGSEFNTEKKPAQDERINKIREPDMRNKINFDIRLCSSQLHTNRSGAKAGPWAKRARRRLTACGCPLLIQKQLAAGFKPWTLLKGKVKGRWLRQLSSLIQTQVTSTRKTTRHVSLGQTPASDDTELCFSSAPSEPPPPSLPLFTESVLHQPLCFGILKTPLQRENASQHCSILTTRWVNKEKRNSPSMVISKTVLRQQHEVQESLSSHLTQRSGSPAPSQSAWHLRPLPALQSTGCTPQLWGQGGRDINSTAVGSRIWTLFRVSQ